MTRVLVVDDNEENLYYLRALLEGHGEQVIAAHHGAEALVLARQTPPDVVISDLLMPVMDGFTLLRHWKADSSLKSVPFIVYTATYTEPEDEKLALSLGADAFILKPTEPNEFLTRLDATLDQSASTPPSVPEAGAAPDGMLKEYSQTLIRKLEEKMLQLEESNRALQRDMALREAVTEELRRTEEKLRHSQKMEAVGRLAGGIAHDFNNLLTVILSYTDLALEDLPPGQGPREAIIEIGRAGQRASELTKQLLALSRRQVLQPKVLDLNRTLRDMEKLLRRLLGEDVDLQLLVETPVHNIHADPGQMSQIVMNLAVNARDAMPTGGKLTIETSNCAIEGSRSSQPAQSPGEYVRLTVTDTGSGMDTVTRERIFEPFFTTKEVGKGTGLGLATVFGIVTQSGGHIEVESEPSRGTTFKIYFPSTDRPYESQPAVPPVPVELRGTETILLVEDDPQVRAVNSAILQRHGYRVLEAQNGGEAFLLSEKFLGTIHLLLTDVVMPRISGRELVLRLTPMRPEMKVLYVSGYTEDAIVHHGLGSATFLSKPITPLSLLRHVREALRVTSQQS